MTLAIIENRVTLQSVKRNFTEKSDTDEKRKSTVGLS